MKQFADLLVEPNPPKARRTGARELIASPLPQSIDLLLSVLQNDKDPFAQMAVIEVIADTGDPSRRFIEPLMVLLGSKDEKIRDGAAVALAIYKDGGVIDRLSKLARGAGQPAADLAARLAAIRALSQMSDSREAIDALISLLGDASPEVQARAIQSIREAAGIEFDGDIAAIRRWWEVNREKSSIDRLRDRVRVLSKQNRQLQKDLEAAQTTLVATLRDLYLLKPDAQKADTLLEYLRHPSENVRLLGLELVGAMQTDRKPVPEIVLRRVRSLIPDVSSRVRQKVVLTLRDLHATTDADLILAQYRQETDSGVRAAMLNALGRLRNPEAIDVIIESLSSDDKQVVVEGALSLGVLGEKGTAPPEKIAPAVAPLLACYRKWAGPDQQLREQLMEAMALIADPQFSPVFINGLASEKDAAVRQAAARGIAALGKPENAELLIRHLSDPDAGVRRTVVESLARLAKSDADLEALFARLDTKNESDATVRDKAWEGIRQILRSRSVAEQRRWALRLNPRTGKATAEHCAELLVDVEKEMALASPPPTDLNEVREQLADAFSAAGQFAEAARVYGLAYDDLLKTRKPRAWEVGLKLFNARLQADRYEEALASVDELRKTATTKQRDDLAGLLYDHLNSLLKAGEPNRALDVLDRTGNRFEGAWATKFAQLRREVEQLRREQDVATVRRCIAQLRGDPAEVERAQQQVRALGARGVVLLADELRAVITATEADPVREKQILDLLKHIASSGWKGYPDQADRASKLRALDELVKSGS
jgi:HEAT repeat protein